MTTAIVPANQQNQIALSPSVAAFARSSKSPNTINNYESSSNDFLHFCQSHKVSALPASYQTVVANLDLASQGNKAATLKTKLAGIAYFHRLAKAPDPTKTEEVKAVMSGIRRTLGTAPDRKAPITRIELVVMTAALPKTRTGLRDRAILLLGFGGAFRRSELVGLNFEDFEFVGGRMIVTLRKSKTDQEARGLKKSIPALDDDKICPVQATIAWLNASGIRNGPLFRKVDRHNHLGARALSDHTIATLIKQAAKRVGLDVARFSGHSLRAGFITQSALEETPEWQIQEVSGHRNTAVLRDYIRDAGAGQQRAIKRAFGEGEKTK